MTHGLRGAIAALVATMLALGAGSTLGAAPGRLLVYSIIQQDETERLLEGFTRQTGIPAQFVRGTGGAIVTRVIAERGNPRADVVLGGASNLHLTMKKEGALLPYVSPATAGVPREYRDSVGYWTGFYLTALGFGINEERFRRRLGARPLPQTWEALTDRAYRGEIVLTDPVVSSTSYLFLSGVLQMLGPQAGWNYVARLVPNVAQFPSSGTAPPRMVGAGEFAIGISFVHSFARSIEQGLSLRLVIPQPTIGEVGAVSIISGGPNAEAARRFVDYMTTQGAQQIYTRMSFTTPIQTGVTLPPGAIPRQQLRLIRYDAEAAARDRDAILREWTQRFGTR